MATWRAARPPRRCSSQCTSACAVHHARATPPVCCHTRGDVPSRFNVHEAWRSGMGWDGWRCCRVPPTQLTRIAGCRLSRTHVLSCAATATTRCYASTRAPGWDCCAPVTWGQALTTLPCPAAAQAARCRTCGASSTRSSRYALGSVGSVALCGERHCTVSCHARCLHARVHHGLRVARASQRALATQSVRAPLVFGPC